MHLIKCAVFGRKWYFVSKFVNCSKDRYLFSKIWGWKQRICNLRSLEHFIQIVKGQCNLTIFWALNNINYRKVVNRSTSWLVTPHVTNWIQIQLVTCPKINLKWVKVVQRSWNFVRFHEILNHKDAKNFSFLTWQTKKFCS